MNTSDLTTTELLVYTLFTQERLTPRKIASRLKKKPNSIYVHLHNIRKKGLINPAGEGVLRKGGGVLNNLKSGDLRLEAQQFKIRILWASSKYYDSLKVCNVINDFKGNRVLLYDDMIEVYSRKHFHGEDVELVSKESFEYWEGWARKLEARLGIIILKEGYQNWKIVKSGEYARENSDVAEQAVGIRELEKIRGEDGKVWWQIDWSNQEKGPEDETVHPVRSKADRNIVDYYLNDFRENSPPNNSELYALLAESVADRREAWKMHRETNAALAAVLKLMKPPSSVEVGLSEKPDYLG